ncbi:minor capsid protein [Bacillus sp. CH30_1T]|uniref:minor capsid protein n=1 Tax=Bacillus sp. CH30_1T TaxID=2604836 RepID=UPI00165D9055|nr:minor capsid protein [Bacillus sp. CH30_1T]
MANNKAYWEKRMVQLYNAQDKRDAKFDKKMRKEYYRLESDIQKDIASYYQKYGKNDIIEFRKLVVQLSDSERNLLFRDYEEFMRRNPKYRNLMPVRESIYKLNRLEGLQLSIRMKMMELGTFEQEGFEKLLQEAYQSGYLSSMKGLVNTPAFFNVNSEVMMQTINEKWINGENFSDRIWKNKEKLINTLNNEIRDGIIRGDSYKKMAQIIQYRTGVGASNTMALVQTESAFVLNQANKQAFMDAGVLRYEVSAVMDKKTSPTCRNMDGQQFEFKDAKVGVNYSPFHTRCRTTQIPIENDS